MRHGTEGGPLREKGGGPNCVGWSQRPAWLSSQSGQNANPLHALEKANVYCSTSIGVTLVYLKVK